MTSVSEKKDWGMILTKECPEKLASSASPRNLYCASCTGISRMAESCTSCVSASSGKGYFKHII